jgi:anti-anti-sigma factor
MIIDHQIARGSYMLIVNLEGVDYISSIGWGVFISNLKEMRENGGDIVLANMSANVHNIFDLMELSAIMKSFTDVNKAAAHFLGTSKQPAVKKKAVGAETTSGTAKKASSATVESSQRPQPKQPEPEPTAADAKPSIKTHRTPANRPGRRPARIKLVSDNITDLDGVDYRYTQSRLLEKHIIRVVLDKPFLSVGKITKALRLPKYGSVKQKKRRIKKELVKLGLENPEDRYEFALRNRQ